MDSVFNFIGRLVVAILIGIATAIIIEKVQDQVGDLKEFGIK